MGTSADIKSSKEVLAAEHQRIKIRRHKGLLFVVDFDSHIRK